MERVVEILREILEIPSPTGYTKEVLTHIEKRLNGAGIKTYYTNKGGADSCQPSGAGARDSGSC